MPTRAASLNEPKRPWEGYAILGSGRLAVVYSDDSRITRRTHARGIQHLYFDDYTADYVSSTGFDLFDADGKLMPPRDDFSGQTSMKNFFTTETTAFYDDASGSSVLCFVHPSHAAAISLEVSRGASPNKRFRFQADLRKEIKTDTTISLTHLHEVDNVIYANWSNGIVLAIASGNPTDTLVVGDASVIVSGILPELSAKAVILLVPGSSRTEALSNLKDLQRTNVEESAGEYWDAWMSAGFVPGFPGNTPQAMAYRESYKRNLYCMKAANLKGQIPWDVTGHFVTNNMPRLYPRIAMTFARIFLTVEHPEEAEPAILFWTSPHRPRKTPGEWYAAYDAHGKPIDAGSGTRFDEPAWDTNGYVVQALDQFYRDKLHLLGGRDHFYQVADFLVNHIGQNGLLEDAGIVEFTGYLPATNMTCSAALGTAAKAAHDFGDEPRSRTYAQASQTIAAALPELFDSSRETYADLQITRGDGPKSENRPGQATKNTYVWDTTANFGVVWGYPDHRDIELSNIFYAKNTLKLEGGMQLFDCVDPTREADGHAVFFYTTAAASQYQSIHKDKAAAKSFIDWMMWNANTYGLMPERINLDETVSPASPLPWSCAEFVAAMLLWTATEAG